MGLTIASANTQTIKQLWDKVDDASLSNKTELRSQVGSKNLYEKEGGVASFFRSIFPSSARVQKQQEARAMVNDALKKEFEDVAGGAVMEAAVRKNMQKELTGSGKFTVGDLTKIKNEIERVKDKVSSYSASKANLSKDPQFEAGKKEFRSILPGIEGFKAGMDSFDTVELYTKLTNSSPKPYSDQVKKELGALGAYVRELGCDISDVKDLTNSAEMVQAAMDHGATSAKALPQMVPMRQIGNADDIAGRCLALSTLTALAEARTQKGADHLMRRLENEVQTMRGAGLRERADYAKDLEGVHNTTGASRTKITDKDGAQIKTIGHRAAIEHLAEQFEAADGEPVMYGVETKGHMMMIGATHHDGEDSFIFYDPCSGLSRFQNKEELSNFLDHYFGEGLEFAKEFDMPNMGDAGFEFTAVSKFNTDLLATLPIGETNILDMIEPEPPPTPLPGDFA